MKKILILFVVVLFVSCGKNESNKTNNQKADVVNIGKESVSIQYKFKRGDKFSYKMTTVAATGQTLKTDTTMSTELNQTVEYVFDFDIVDVDADKIAEFNVTIRDIKVDATANGKKFSYKSGNEIKEEDKKNFVEYEAMYKIPFRIRVNNIGEVVEVSRTNKIVDNIIKLQGAGDSISVQEKQQFAANLNEGAIKPLVQQFFRRIPTTKINVDSSWVFKYPSSIMVYTIENSTVYKVKNFEKINDELIAKISLDLQVTWKGKNKMTDRGVNYSFGDPKISGSGAILFNLDRGLLQKSNTNTKLEINILMQASVPKPMTATRKDFTLNTNSIELIK
ncbi:MAG: DUF6263 family protein [bacterium]